LPCLVKITNAQSLATRIADWRDEDDLSRPNGAEGGDYAGAHNDEDIGNRPFSSVGELRLVLNIPEELLDCASPALTILGDDGIPDGKLLSTLYGRTLELPEQTHTTRLGTSNRRISVGRRYSITATARSDSGRKYQLTGLFRITGSKLPFEFIAIYPTSATTKNHT